jgi:hypothetical protein
VHFNEMQRRSSHPLGSTIQLIGSSGTGLKAAAWYVSSGPVERDLAFRVARLAQTLEVAGACWPHRLDLASSSAP